MKKAIDIKQAFQHLINNGCEIPRATKSRFIRNWLNEKTMRKYLKKCGYKMVSAEKWTTP